MQTKWSHELSVVVEPHTNLARRISDSFLLADLLTANGSLGSGTSGILLRGATLSNVGNWLRIGPDLQLQNVDYTRTNADGTVSNRYSPHSPTQTTMGGYHVTANHVPKDLNIVGDGTGNMGFEVISGDFRTVPAAGGYGKAIYVTGAASGISEAKSTTMLGRNGDFRARVQLLSSKVQLGAGDIPYAVIPFGQQNNWRVALCHRMYPAIQRLREGTWDTVRRIDESGLVQVAGDEWNINIRNLGEKLIFDLNGVQGWCSDTSPSGRPSPALWDEAAIGLQTNACRARFEYGEETHRNADGTPIIGTISRKAYFGSSRNGNGKPSQLIPLIDPVPAGYLGGGTRQVVTVVEESDGVRYTDTLTPNALGLQSPMASSVFLGYSPVWSSPTNSAGINISSLVSSASAELAYAPVQRSNTASLEIPYSLIDKMSSEEKATTMAAIRDGAPIIMKSRWRDENGNAVAGEAGQWAPVFDGIINGISNGISIFNGRTLNIKAMDKIALMTDNRGVVDGGAYPLDVLIHRKNQQLATTIGGGYDGGEGYYTEDDTDFSTDPPTRYISVYNEAGELVYKRPVSAQDYSVLDVYGGECMEEILRMALPPADVAMLNGGVANENEFLGYVTPAMRFFPGNHLPLLPFSMLKGGILPISQAFGESASSGQLTGGKFIFGPNYLETYLAWGEKFEKDDNAILRFGHTDRTAGGRFVPIYGQNAKYLQRCGRVWSVDESVLASLDFESRPEKSFNCVLVVSNIAGQDATGMGVGLRSGEARLPASHPNSEENTGRRVLVVKSNYGFVPGGAEALAYSILAELPGGVPQWPTKTLSAGEGWIFPGDVVFGSNLSHSAPELQNVMFSAARIAHKWSQNGVSARDWATTITLGPLSATQVTAALANRDANGEFTLRI